MSEISNALLTNPDLWPNPAVKELAALVGTWNVEVRFPGADAPLTGGQAIFEWLEHGYFLVQRSLGPRTDFPQGYAIMGSDGTMGSYSMIYYDSRGVSRIYQMSLANGVWKLWRDDPDFPQRFTGTFSEDGKTIHAAWEKAEHGGAMAVDFYQTYTKVSTT